VTISGTTYHLQELAFFGWFFGWDGGVNGWYSTQVLSFHRQAPAPENTRCCAPDLRDPGHNSGH
jgi:hypothetical protein